MSSENLLKYGAGISLREVLAWLGPLCLAKFKGKKVARPYVLNETVRSYLKLKVRSFVEYQVIMWMVDILFFLKCVEYILLYIPICI